MTENEPARDALAKLSAAIRRLEASSLQEKDELLRLLAGVREELKGLAETHEERAARIAEAVGEAAHAASRGGAAKGGMESRLKNLEAAIEGFETTHPKLVMAINGISTMLARIGV